MEIKEMVRKEILGFQPYLPGKPISAVKRELGLRGEIIKLASNENPSGASAGLINAIKKAAKDINIYPDGSSFAIRKTLAKKYRLNQDNIIAGSGTDEIIEIIAKTFFKPEDEIVVSEHAFIRYKMAGELMSCKVVSVPMKNYTHDLSAMLNAVTDRTKAVFIANPNNPTGTYNTKNDLQEFLLKLNNTVKPLVVVDEAYYEYACVEKDYPDSIELRKLYPRLITLRTFSKVYGLAGLRVGYGVADEEIIGYLDRVRPPFNVNSLAQAAASAVAGNSIKKVIKNVQDGKRYVCGELDRMGIAYLPSAANFVLVDVSPLKGMDIFKWLLRKRIIVRSMDEYDYPNHFRVTIGTPEQNRKFIKAFKEVLGKK